jgi:hypothetical protein
VSRIGVTLALKTAVHIVTTMLGARLARHYQKTRRNPVVSKTSNKECIRKVAVHLQTVVEVMSTSFYIGLKPFNFIRKHFLQICVRKFAVRLKNVIEVISMSDYTGLNRTLKCPATFRTHCTYNVTKRRVRLTIIAVKIQNC